MWSVIIKISNKISLALLRISQVKYFFEYEYVSASFISHVIIVDIILFHFENLLWNLFINQDKNNNISKRKQ